VRAPDQGFVVEIDAFSRQPLLLQSALNAIGDLMDLDRQLRTMPELSTMLSRWGSGCF
jgi:hypothetical protein